MSPANRKILKVYGRILHMEGSMSSVPTAMAQDFMRDLINKEPLIGRLAMDLQRMDVVFDKSGNPTFKSYGKPRMTEEGVRDIISRIRSVMNTNTEYSYISEDDFRIMMRMNTNTMAVRIWAKRKDWGIESTDYFVICDMVADLMEMAVRKAIGKNFQEFTSSSRNTQETIIKEDQNRSGLLSGIFGPSQKKVL